MDAALVDRFPSLGWGEREWFVALKIDDHMYRAILGDMARVARKRPTAYDITGREREFLQAVADGHTVPAVARRFGLAVDTVKTTLGNVRRRLGAKTTAHAVAIALGEGVIDAPQRLAA